MSSSERRDSRHSSRDERSRSPQKSRSRSRHHSRSHRSRDRSDRDRPQYDYDDGRNNRNEGNNLYIANLSSRVTEEDLRKEFENIGPIKSINIPLDNEGHNRGFAFLTFESSGDAKRALDERFNLFERVLTVELAHRNAGYKPTPGVYLGKQSLSYRRRNDESRSSRHHHHSRSRDRSRHRYHSRSRDRSRSRDGSRHRRSRDRSYSRDRDYRRRDDDRYHSRHFNVCSQTS